MTRKISALLLILFVAGLPLVSLHGQELLPRESVLVSIDRNMYLPGDEILFTATVVEADNYRPSDLSKVLRIEVLDSEGSSIVQEKYMLENSQVSQSLILPRGINSGWYQLRAYTNWMRNFPVDDYACFKFRVVNLDDINQHNISDHPDTIIVELLPGPGGLLNKVENEFAVRATDVSGTACAVKGYITSSGDTITSFETGQTGWTTVNFTPAATGQYSFVLSSSENIILLSRFPGVKDNGSSVSLGSSGRSIEAMLHSPGLADGSKINLLVHSKYTWYQFEPAVINNGEAKIIIPAESIPGGVVQFTFFDTAENILGEHLWINGNPMAEGSEISVTDAMGENSTMKTAEYRSNFSGTKGLYTLIVKKKEPSGAGNLYIPGLPGWNSDNSIPLDAGERKGWIIANSYNREIPASFFPLVNSQPATCEFNFKDIPSKRESRVDFMPETRGLTLNGNIKVKESGEPVYNEIMAITTLYDNSFYTAHTFSSGRFHFSIRGKTDKEDMILTYVRPPEGNWEYTVFPDFDTRVSHPLEDRFTLTTNELDYITDLALTKKLESVYSLATDSLYDQGKPEHSSGRMFYGYPDESVIIDKYIRLPNIREVLFEVVPAVITRKKDEHFVIKVMGDNPFPRMYPALVLLDGIPIIEYDKLLELSPDRFRKIEVIKSLYIHGNAIFAGVVNFISVNGDMAGLDLPSESKIISLKMPLKAKDLNPVIPDSPKPGIPVLSPLLVFQSYITDGNGSFSFRTSDNHGEYELLFSGFTSGGRYVKSSATFTVSGKFNNN